MILILEILGIKFSTPNKSECKILFDEIENIDLIRKASRCIYSYQQDLNFKTLQNIFFCNLNVDQDLMNYIEVMSEDFDYISNIVIHTVKHINEEIMF